MSSNLGQNWLQNRAILEEIAELTGGGEICVEIGPGLGTLTTSLLRRFDKVIAVEFDEKLAKNLPGSFPGTNLEVVNQDILKFDFSTIKGAYKVAGNIPYYITSPIIEKVLTAENLPEKIVLLMQKEVAERVCAEKETGLSLFVKNRARANLGPVVAREEFTPVPKVDSRVLILEPFMSGPKYPEKMFKLIKIAFASPRKKLIHNLSSIRNKDELMKIFEKLNFDPNIRPADLHLDDYYRLFCDIM